MKLSDSGIKTVMNMSPNAVRARRVQTRPAMPPNAAVFCCLKVRFSARSLLHVNHTMTLVIIRPAIVATTSTVLRTGSSSLPCGPYLT